MKYLLIFISLKLIAGDISIEITTGAKLRDVSVTYSGNDVMVISEDEIKLFGLGDKSFKEALNTSFSGRIPKDVFLKSPTWDDVYKHYNWNKISRDLSIESARVKSLKRNPIVVTSQDFSNWLSNPIKVTAVLTQAVQNTLIVTWDNYVEVSGIEHDLNIIFTRLFGSSNFSYKSSWGNNVVKSETIVLGTTSAVETEVDPLKAVTASLTATKADLEVEVTYVAKLKGHVAVRFVKEDNGSNFWIVPIQEVLKKAGKPLEIRSKQLLKFGFYSNATMEVSMKTPRKVKPATWLL